MYHYWALFGLKWHYLGYIEAIRIQIRICEPDADWSGWTQIYRTYCNVPSLALICCKMALFGLFCCNPDPDLDFWWTCRFWLDGAKYTQLTVKYHYVAEFAVKCPNLSYFAVIWIWIRILMLTCTVSIVWSCYLGICMMYMWPICGQVCCEMPWFVYFGVICGSGSGSRSGLCYKIKQVNRHVWFPIGC